MILPFEGGEPTKRFNIISVADAFTLDWSIDEHALLYIDNVANILSQFVDGGKPFQLTNFQSDQTFDFAYSRDSNWLAVARGTITSDVVLIADSR